jgi:hypothetical protein
MPSRPQAPSPIAPGASAPIRSVASTPPEAPAPTRPVAVAPDVTPAAGPVVGPAAEPSVAALEASAPVPPVTVAPGATPAVLPMVGPAAERAAAGNLVGRAAELSAVAPEVRSTAGDRAAGAVGRGAGALAGGRDAGAAGAGAGEAGRAALGGGSVWVPPRRAVLPRGWPAPESWVRGLSAAHRDDGAAVDDCLRAFAAWVAGLASGGRRGDRGPGWADRARTGRRSVRADPGRLAGPALADVPRRELDVPDGDLRPVDLGDLHIPGRATARPRRLTATVAGDRCGAGDRGRDQVHDPRAGRGPGGRSGTHRAAPLARDTMAVAGGADRRRHAGSQPGLADIL